MNTSKYPLIWGHRGASGYAPENTLPAFKMAADMGADGVELDIQMTKDGEIVVCHDEAIDRTSSGKGWLKDFTFEELRRLDFSNGNSAYEGVKIPTMEEVFDLLEPTGLLINIEIKTGIVFYEKIEEKILELTKRKHWEDRVIYSSFNHYIRYAGSKSWIPKRRQAFSTETVPLTCPVTDTDLARTLCTPLSTISSILISWRTAANTVSTSMSGPSTPPPNFGPAGSTA